jgi:ribonuclease-3
MVSAEYIFEKFPNKQEGFMTKLRTKLVRDTQLAHLGFSLGFDRWLLISNHIERIGGRKNGRLVEDLYESFIGALYRDQGFSTSRDFIFRCFDKYIDIKALSTNNDNYKDMLLRFFQINGWDHPRYNTLSHTGTSVDRKFTTAVVVEKVLCEDSIFYNDFERMTTRVIRDYNAADNEFFYIEVASGKTKKISEQLASKLALKLMKVPENF